MPFFVVVQDNSTYEPGTVVESSTESGDSASVVPGNFVPNSLYPEVRYIFSDDDFSATIEALEQTKDDISVIVDFDSSGEKIVNCQSISTNWQVTNASVTAATSPAWMAQDSASSSFKLIVQGTGDSIVDSKSITGDSSEPPAERIRRLIHNFQDRNQQLKQLLRRDQYVMNSWNSDVF